MIRAVSVSYEAAPILATELVSAGRSHPFFPLCLLDSVHVVDIFSRSLSLPIPD